MMKAIFQAIVGVLKILIIAIKGDQPKRQEIESSMQDLWKEDEELERELRKETTRDDGKQNRGT